MQAVIEKVSHPDNYSFSTEKINLPYFISNWHFHHSYEINLVLKGTGNAFIGDKIMAFGPGTLFLLGQGLPHVLLNDEQHYKKTPGLTASSIVVKFNYNFLGGDFFSKPELYRINQLLRNSKQGISFHKKTMQTVQPLLNKLLTAKGFQRISLILSVLDSMSQSKDRELIVSHGFQFNTSTRDCERIDKVYKYVMDNFTQAIALKNVANVANLSTTAFCRYFKSRTLKTFSQFLNEIRIGHACKLLIEKKLSTSEIAYVCGYNYPSNFHKQFKKLMHLTPLEYQKKYWEHSSL